VPSQSDPWRGIDLDGPIQAEVFVVWLVGDTIEVTGPCGPEAWYIEATGEHPVDVVRGVVSNTIGEPELVHSTSWRQGSDGVILSFLVVVERSAVLPMASRPVRRAELARSGATAAPTAIGNDQVLEHALRHLAWLARDDEVVGARLSPAWREALSGYVPEPFRNLG